MTIQLTCEAVDDKARATTIKTAHGEIKTPVFMPVGTYANVKGCLPETLKEIGVSILLANTYHLMLRPKQETFTKLGGLHKFMSWPGPILTDSGGFQLMSLAKNCTIDESGALFRSHIDGSLFKLTPENATEMQLAMGSTISMVLDKCIKLPADDDFVWQAMKLSVRWAERCRNHFPQRPGYAQFGIIQGGLINACRNACLEELLNIDFDGYAIGGLAVGESFEQRQSVLDSLNMPDNKPRYLMGVGKPLDILDAIKQGIDMFDCVLPTRNARNGQALTYNGALTITNAKFCNDSNSLDDACSCLTCKNHCRAYLHHLFRCKEMLGPILLSRHNLYFYQSFMREARTAIIEGKFESWHNNFKNKYEN